MPGYSLSFLAIDAGPSRSEQIMAADVDDAASIAGVMMREDETRADISAVGSSGVVACLVRAEDGRIERAR